MNEDFKKMFDKKMAVVGFDYNIAIDIMSGIEKTCGKTVSKKFQSRKTLTLETDFTDGTRLIWVKGSESSRGFKFGKMWCDKNIDREIFDLVIMPSYFGEYEDIVWM